MQREEHRSPALQLLVWLFVRRIHERLANSDEVGLHLFDPFEWDRSEDRLDLVQFGRVDADGEFGPVEEGCEGVVGSFGGEDGDAACVDRVGDSG